MSDPVYLRTPEECALFLEAALEEAPDPAYIVAALGEVARAHGMTKNAHEAGISREGLYKALSETGNPSFACPCMECRGATPAKRTGRSPRTCPSVTIRQQRP